MKKRIVALIPARGGSKGIIKKNLSLLKGRPLLAYAIEIGLACNLIDRVIVSTDDPEIAKVAKDFGAEVPFLRPNNIAQDDTPDRPVFVHLIHWLSEHENYNFDYLVNLRCTTPLKKLEHVEKAINLLSVGNFSSIRSMTKIDGKNHPYWCIKLNENQYATPFIDGLDITKYHRRQLLPPAYAINGLVDIMKVDVILNHEKPYGDSMGILETESIYGIDIDSKYDLHLCEKILDLVNPALS
ncbi:MAG: acylneuraminate cytidylyltransferase family protein [Oligoflexia bacterium]|nr:acylneuraminate cytidylyltransferase family protein [Oligoflexia bacterium]